MTLRDAISKVSPRWRKRLLWAGGLVLAYTVIGFLILPLIVRAVTVKRLSSLLGREVTIQKVRLNPYALSGTIRGLLIKDNDGERFVAFEEAYGNFQLSSFFGKPWVFKEVRVVRPFARVQVNKDQTLNFSDILQKLAQSAKTNLPAKPSKPLALCVQSFHIIGAEASFADLTPSTAFRRKLGPVELRLTGFHTDPDNKNPYSFSGTNDSGETFEWSGYFFFDPLRSGGELAVKNVSLPNYAPICQDLLKFELRGGAVDLQATYELAWSGGVSVATVTNTSFRLRGLKVAERNSQTNLAELSEMAVTGLHADAVARRAVVDSVSVHGGRLLVQRSPEARLNVIEVAQPASTNISGSVLLLLQSVTNLFAQLITSTNLAQGLVRRVDVRDCALAFEDLANPRPVQLALTDFSLAATNLSNLPGSNLTAVVSLRWSTNGAIRAQAMGSLYPPGADLQFALDGLELAPLGPYLDPFVSVYITGSRLNMDGQLTLRATNELGPNAWFAGNLRMADFASVDGETGEDLVRFGEASFAGIQAQLNPPEFTANELLLRDFSAQVVLETNGALNLVRLIRLPDTNAPEPPVVEGVASAKPVRASGKKSFADLRRQFGGVLRLYSATNLAAMPVPVKSSVSRVVLSNAAVFVTDRSVSPPAQTSLRDVNGQVTGLSSELREEIAVKAQAKVDQTGPVDITASLPPPGPAVTNRLSVAIRNVDLHPAGVYSGKYLGYALRKGKLNVDMNYEMTARQIRAQNVVTLDQFTLGEKVASPDATKLPVKLAVAILKDRKGQIELKVPVEGNLDDPKFRLGPVITHTFVNVIAKIVTSPFAALGSLFGGKGEEVRFQEFAPASTELTQASVQKLDSVIHALYERPGLELEMEGSIDPITDRDAFRRQRLDKEFKSKKWASLRKSEQERLSPEQVTLSAEEYATFLQQAYNRRLAFDELAKPSAGGAKAEDSAPPATGVARTGTKPQSARDIRKGAENLVKPAVPAAPAAPKIDIEREVLESVEVPDTDYRALAAGRANAVKDYILKSGKVESERLFLTEFSSASASTNGSRVYLHLK